MAENVPSCFLKVNCDKKNKGTGACSVPSSITLTTDTYEKISFLKLENKVINSECAMDSRKESFSGDTIQKGKQTSDENEETENVAATHNETAICTIVIQNDEKLKESEIAISKKNECEKTTSSNLWDKLGLKLDVLNIFQFSWFCCELFLKKIDNVACNLLWGFTSVAAIVFGLKYLAECPKEHFIPIQLFISGLFCLMICLLSLIFKSAKLMNKFNLKVHDVLSTLISASKWTMLTWHFFGCYLIYHIPFPKTEKSAGKEYCNPILYAFTFLVIHLWLFVICCNIIVFIVAMCYYKNKQKSLKNASNVEKSLNTAGNVNKLQPPEVASDVEKQCQSSDQPMP